MPNNDNEAGIANSGAMRLFDVCAAVAEQGFAWVVPLPIGFAPGNSLAALAASRLILYENGQELGPPHVALEVIRRTGGGTYLHWQDALYFSTSDGSDPRTNGRQYGIALSADDRPYPLDVYIETINTCNARCPFCPLFQGDSLLDRTVRPATIMSWGLFEKCAREIAAWPRKPATIYPHANGEPLQDPQFPRRLALLGELGLGRLLNLHTNGQFLSEKLARAILAAGVRTVSVAFDGASKSVYEAHRVRCDYDRVLNNIKGFVRLRRALGARTEIVIIYVRTRDNEHEVAAAYEMFAHILDPTLDEFHDKLSSDWADEAAGGDFFRLPKDKARPVNGCAALEHQLVISADGALAACCVDYNLTVSQGGFGSAEQDSLIDLWRGQKRAAVAAQLRLGQLGAMPEKCRECPVLFGQEQADFGLAKISAPAAVAGSLGFIYRFPDNPADL